MSATVIRLADHLPRRALPDPEPPPLLPPLAAAGFGCWALGLMWWGDLCHALGRGMMPPRKSRR